MKQIILTVLLSCLPVILCDAQDLHFSDLYSTLHHSNPSSIASLENPRAGVTYRNQWPGLSSVYVTYNAFYFHPVQQLNSTVGADLIHDVQAGGALTRTGFSLLYAYAVNITDQVRIAAGMQFAYVRKRIDPDKLVFESDLTGTTAGDYPIGYESYRTDIADFALGLTAFFEYGLFAGISVHHITTPTDNLAGNALGNLYPRYTVHAGGLIDLNERSVRRRMTVKPAVHFQMQGKYTEFLYGSSLNIKPFEFGLWARNDIRFHFDAAILLLGFSRENYTFYYCYDVNMKKMRFFSPGIGSHEVTFYYDFKYKDKRKNRGAIKCPKI